MTKHYKTLRKAGYSKLSSKYLSKKAGGNKMKKLKPKLNRGLYGKIKGDATPGHNVKMGGGMRMGTFKPKTVKTRSPKVKRL